MDAGIQERLALKPSLLLESGQAALDEWACGCQFSRVVMHESMQVEARMRQLEGRQLAVEGAKPKGKEQPAKYDKTKQGGANGALAAVPKAYNADADVPAAVEAAPEEKKKVSVRIAVHGIHAQCPVCMAVSCMRGLMSG